ncbi:MAG: hypothetical protein AAF236_02240 [Verrucomicrobiota bacterium]
MANSAQLLKTLHTTTPLTDKLVIAAGSAGTLLGSAVTDFLNDWFTVGIAALTIAIFVPRATIAWMDLLDRRRRRKRAETEAGDDLL